MVGSIMSYTTINIDQFRDVLPAERGWQQTTDQYGEYVLEWQIPSMPTGTVIKCYTTCRKRNQLSRFRAEDSIKVCCVYKSSGLVKSVRIYRVPGWQSRVRAAVSKVLHMARQRRSYLQCDKVVWPSRSSQKPLPTPRTYQYEYDDEPGMDDNVYPPGHPLEGEIA